MTTQREIPIRSQSPPGTRDRFRFVRGLALFVGSLLVTGMMRAEVAKEYQIKAAFLYNLTKFVEWPAQSFPVNDAPLIIGVLGKNPFGDELEKIVRDRTVNGHRISLIYLQSPADVKSLPVACHVLFVGAGDEALFARLPVGDNMLTVGESAKFAAGGGIVTFVVVNDKIRFEINADSAEYAGLKISAQLLKLATAVRKKS